jgi:hypothetical protein
MSNLPHPQQAQPVRPARIRPAEYTPAVLRVEDGSCTQATVELFSLTGGLLSLPKPLDKGSRPRLMFLTKTGPVLGVAEMLKPVSWTEQPFRFIGLHEDGQHRLVVATGAAAEVAIEMAAKNSVAGRTAERGLAAAAAAVIAPEPPAAPLVEVPSLDSGDPWIQKYRAALDGDEEVPSRWPRIFAAVTAASVAVGVIVYIMQAHLLR